MNSLDKRRIALAGAAAVLVVICATSGPIAEFRVTQDVTAPSINRVEAKIDLGIVAFSFLKSWKRILP